MRHGRHGLRKIAFLCRNNYNTIDALEIKAIPALKGSRAFRTGSGQGLPEEGENRFQQAGENSPCHIEKIQYDIIIYYATSDTIICFSTVLNRLKVRKIMILFSFH